MGGTALAAYEKYTQHMKEARNLYSEIKALRSKNQRLSEQLKKNCTH